MPKSFHLDNNYFTKPLKYGDVSILQIGRKYCTEEVASSEHIHLYYFELTVVTGGKGQIATNDIASSVERGDIYMSFPYDKHFISSDPNDPLKFDFFAFICDNDEINSELEYLMQNYHSPNTRIFRDERVNAQIGNLISELGRERIFSEKLISSTLEQILIYVIRGFRKITPKNTSDVITKPEILCYQLMHYIDTHIYSMKNLQELSEITSYSYGYISSVFKKTTSQTLSHYYNSKKSDISRLLLSENILSISEIAEQLNFSSVYAFSKAFKNSFGISPREYRKRLGEASL